MTPLTLKELFKYIYWEGLGVLHHWGVESTMEPTEGRVPLCKQLGAHAQSLKAAHSFCLRCAEKPHPSYHRLNTILNIKKECKKVINTKK